MKVLAINSSPTREGLSVTRLLLDKLITGMEGAGGEVETIHLKDKNIKMCIGCQGCWSKHPGTCIIKDDMSDILPKFINADLVVLATPMYFNNLNGYLKNFIDRTLPFQEPFWNTDENGDYYHPFRGKHPKVVALSVAGWAKDWAFGYFSDYMKHLYRDALVAEIYRGCSQILAHHFSYTDLRDQVLDNTEKAGAQLVEQGKIEDETLEKITQPVEDLDTMISNVHLIWKTCISKGQNMGEFIKSGSKLYPVTLEDFIEMMRLAFNPGSAPKKLTIQFNFTGSVTDSCFIVFDKTSYDGFLGEPPKADVTITSDYDLWLDILHGKEDGRKAFSQKKYNVEGNFALFMKFGTFFSGK